MNQLSPPKPNIAYYLLSLSLFLSVWAGSACSDADTPSVERPPEPEVSCETSEDCNGGICVLQICRECADDESCAADAAYGAGSTCGEDGECVSCAGDLGCACGENERCPNNAICDQGVCEACPNGEESCFCFLNDTCKEGLRCTEDLRCEACPAGAEGCACGDGNACDDGLACQGGACVPLNCEPGELDCLCITEDGAQEGTCNEGLTCSDNRICAECSNDIEGCPCEEDECSDDLVCDEDEDTCREPKTCEDLPCVDHQLCEDAQEGTDARCLEDCAPGYAFDAETGTCVVPPQANCRMDDAGSILAECAILNRTCVESDESAECGDCLPDFLPDAATEGSCRAAITCVDLGCDAQNRQCTAHTSSADATCGDCAMGYRPNGALCEPIPTANCNEGAELSILAECTNQNRTCVPLDNGAECGPCVDGYALDPVTNTCTRRLCDDLNCSELGRTCGGEPLAECGECEENLIPTDPNDPTSQCRETLTCLDIECEDGQFCVDQDGVDAICAAWPCLDQNGEPDENQAFRQDLNTCIDCGVRCGVTGETGRIWPFTLENSNRCICETEDNYYLDSGGNFTARACDADGDQWIRASARSTIESNQPALRTNARCNVRTIDRFELRNEYQQSLTVLLCEAGPVLAVACEDNDGCAEGALCTEGVCACETAAPVDLYESVRNDDQRELNRANESDAPTYDHSGNGRRLRTSEITPLTRACISITGDYNDNGVRDVVEWQGQDIEDADADTLLFTRFSHFVELQESFYERDPGAEYGRYIIQEKSRCDADFPVRYDETLDQGDYWKSCTRNRDINFDRLSGNPLVGYDFARWNCANDDGSCETPLPLTDMTPDGAIPPHGLCDEGVTLPPADGIWRGMNHHSQFKCVEIVNALPDFRDLVSPHQRLRGEMADESGLGDFQFNACSVACPEGDNACVSDCDGNECSLSAESREDNGDIPKIECSPTPGDALEVGQVGFTAVRYLDNPSLYTRGCLDEFYPSLSNDEALPWKNLCPGYTSNPDAVVAQANPFNFGSLICGCGLNYGGPNCDLGCIASDTHFGGDNQGETCVNGYCPVTADNGGGRKGFWLCGSSSSVSYENGTAALTHEEGWNFQGEVSSHGIERANLCEGEDCESGFSIR